MANGLPGKVTTAGIKHSRVQIVIGIVCGSEKCISVLFGGTVHHDTVSILSGYTAAWMSISAIWQTG